MANVAVHPDYRRRGIARQMVQAADALARQMGARTMYLQVERDNPAALGLYENAGYSALATRTTWYRPRGLHWGRRRTPRNVRVRRGNEWTQQWAIASQVSPEGLVWPYPLEPEYFRSSGLGRLFGGRPRIRIPLVGLRRAGLNRRTPGN